MQAVECICRSSTSSHWAALTASAGFFPKGVLGKINKPTGYDASASGTIAWDASGPPKLAVQVGLGVH